MDWQFRTKKGFADAIPTAVGDALGAGAKRLTNSEALALVCIAYFQPITRDELSQFFDREVSRDTIAHLWELKFIGPGPRSPQPGSPYSFVGSVAKFGAVRRDLREQGGLSRVGLQRTSLRGRDRALGGALVLPVWDQLP